MNGKVLELAAKKASITLDTFKALSEARTRLSWHGRALLVPLYESFDAGEIARDVGFGRNRKGP